MDNYSHNVDGPGAGASDGGGGGLPIPGAPVRHPVRPGGAGALPDAACGGPGPLRATQDPGEKVRMRDTL